MIRYAVLSLFLAIAPSLGNAATYRVDVTGSTSVEFEVLGKFDPTTGFPVPSPFLLTLDEIPDEALGDFYRSFKYLNTGSLKYSEEAGFFECSGLLDLVCNYGGAGGSPLVPPVGPIFDATLNTFSRSVMWAGADLNVNATANGGTAVIRDDDNASFIFGGFFYLTQFRTLTIDFTSTSVTAIPVAPSMVLLVSAIAGMVVFRRRRSAA